MWVFLYKNCKKELASGNWTRPTGTAASALCLSIRSAWSSWRTRIRAICSPRVQWTRIRAWPWKVCRIRHVTSYYESRTNRAEALSSAWVSPTVPTRLTLMWPCKTTSSSDYELNFRKDLLGFGLVNQWNHGFFGFSSSFFKL